MVWICKHRWSGSNGLVITPVAPRIFSRSNSWFWILAVINMTGRSCRFGSARILAKVVGPSISGIITSIKTRSGCSFCSMDKASAPEFATFTSNFPTLVKVIWAIRRMLGSSSTSNIFLTFNFRDHRSIAKHWADKLEPMNAYTSSSLSWQTLTDEYLYFNSFKLTTLTDEYLYFIISGARS